MAKPRRRSAGKPRTGATTVSPDTHSLGPAFKLIFATFSVFVVLSLIGAFYIVIADRGSDTAKELFHVCTHVFTGGCSGLMGMLFGKGLK